MRGALSRRHARARREDSPCLICTPSPVPWRKCRHLGHLLGRLPEDPTTISSPPLFSAARLSISEASGRMLILPLALRVTTGHPVYARVPQSCKFTFDGNELPYCLVCVTLTRPQLIREMGSCLLTPLASSGKVSLRVMCEAIILRCTKRLKTSVHPSQR